MARVNLAGLVIGLAAGGAAWLYLRYDPSPAVYIPALLAVAALAGLVAALLPGPGFSLGLLAFAIVGGLGLGTLAFSETSIMLYGVILAALGLSAWVLLSRSQEGTFALLAGTLAGLTFFVVLWLIILRSVPVR